MGTQGVALQGTAGSVPDMGNNLDFVAGGAVHSSMANASAGAMNDAMDMRSGMGNAMFGPLGTAMMGGPVTGPFLSGRADTCAAFASGQSMSGFPSMAGWGTLGNVGSGVCADVAFGAL